MVTGERLANLLDYGADSFLVDCVLHTGLLFALTADHCVHVFDVPSLTKIRTVRFFVPGSPFGGAFALLLKRSSFRRAAAPNRLTTRRTRRWRQAMRRRASPSTTT
jgi:hypothetical protein